VQVALAQQLAADGLPDPALEQHLAGMAESMTAAQVERFAAAHRRCSAGGNDQPPPPRGHKLTWRLNDDATITDTFRPEDGAVILQALRASRGDLHKVAV
jgi:hypothetical protein